MRRSSAILLPLAVLVLALALWEIVRIGFRIDSALLPPLGEVGRALWESSGYFLSNTLLTLVEAAAGLLLALIFGFAVALALVRWTRLRKSMMPWVVAAQSIPLVAVSPILISWLGDGVAPRILMAGMLCWFPSAINAVKGMSEVDPVQLWLFRVNKASPAAEIRLLRIPNSLPFLASGIRISASLAFIGAVVAEYGGGDNGLGQVIMTQAVIAPNSANLFSAVLCSAAAGLLLAESAHYLVGKALRRFLLREDGAESSSSWSTASPY